MQQEIQQDRQKVIYKGPLYSKQYMRMVIESSLYAFIFQARWESESRCQSSHLDN